MKSLILAAIGATGILISNPVNAREVRIPAGTIVVVQTLGAISSETAQPGDIVELMVASDVLVDGFRAIAAGAPATGAIGHLEKPLADEGWT